MVNTRKLYWITLDTMAFKSILFFMLTTELCTIGNVVSAHFNTMFVDDYDIGHYPFPAVPRFTRDLNDLEYFNKGESTGFIPEYIGVWDKFIPEMRNKMDMIEGKLFLPRPSENYSPKDVPSSFTQSEKPNLSPNGYVNVNEKETYQAVNMRPQSVLTEDTKTSENSIPDSYLVRANGNQIDWKKGGEDQVALNANPEIYKLTGNINSNFNEEVFNVNQLQTETDSPKDGIRGCYSHCLQSCYGSSTAPSRSHCESTRQSKPLIININSECLTNPGQRFSHRYTLKPKLNANGLEFHSPPQKIHGYSSCPFSDIPPFYY